MTAATGRSRVVGASPVRRLGAAAPKTLNSSRLRVGYPPTCLPREAHDEEHGRCMTLK